MNSHLPPRGPDQPDDELPGDADLKALYGRLPQPVPSAALDSAVLRAAAEAVGARPPSTAPIARLRRRARWPIALGTAATIMLAAGLAWQMRTMPNAPEATAPTTQSMSPEVATSVDSNDASRMTTREELARRQVSEAQHEAAQQQASHPDATRKQLMQAAEANAPQPMPAPPAAMTLPARPAPTHPAAAKIAPSPRDAASNSADSSDLYRNQPTSERAMTAPAAAMKAVPEPVSPATQSRAAPSPAPAPPAALGEMAKPAAPPAPSAPAMPALAPEAALTPWAPAASAPTLPAPAPPAPPAMADKMAAAGAAEQETKKASAPLTPDAELAAIRQLFAKGDTAQARTRLRAFHDAHPQWTLPPELRDELAKP